MLKIIKIGSHCNVIWFDCLMWFNVIQLNLLDVMLLNWFDFIPLCLNRKFQNMFPYFGRWDGWNIPLATVVDFVPLGTISGPGAPDPDLARFHIKVTPMERQRSTPKSLKFLRFYCQFELMNSYQIQKSFKFLWCYWHLCLKPNPWPQENIRIPVVLLTAWNCASSEHTKIIEIP